MEYISSLRSETPKIFSFMSPVITLLRLCCSTYMVWVWRHHLLTMDSPEAEADTKSSKFFLPFLTFIKTLRIMFGSSVGEEVYCFLVRFIILLVYFMFIMILLIFSLIVVS